MAAHSRSWSNSTPAGTAYANTLDTVITQFRTDVDQRMKLEHYHSSDTDDTAEAADGRHQAGLVGVLHKGITASLGTVETTKSGPGEGAMAWDTTTGILYRYDISATQWEPVMGTPTKSIFKVTLTADQELGDNVSGGEIINWKDNGEITIDLGNNFVEASNWFLAPVAGWYVFPGQFQFENCDNNRTIDMYLYKNDGAQTTLIDQNQVTGGVENKDSSIVFPAIPFLLAAGDKVYVHALISGANQNQRVLSGTGGETTWSGYLMAPTANV